MSPYVAVNPTVVVLSVLKNIDAFSERVNKGRRKLLTLTLLYPFSNISLFFPLSENTALLLFNKNSFPDAQPSSCDILPIKSDNVVKPVLIPIKFYMFLMFYYPKR